MLYEKSREMAQMSLQNWTEHEVFTLGWFLMVGLLIIFYAVWLKLLNKSRTTELLLIGALSAVFYHINIMFVSDFLGLVDYTIRILPFHPPIFITSVTLCPIILMLVQQYTSSWKGYVLWSGIGIAFLCFVIFPIYTLAGILKWHNWNVLYHFLVLFGIALLVRLIFLWITGTQKRQLSRHTR